MGRKKSERVGRSSKINSIGGDREGSKSSTVTLRRQVRNTQSLVSAPSGLSRSNSGRIRRRSAPPDAYNSKLEAEINNKNMQKSQSNSNNGSTNNKESSNLNDLPEESPEKKSRFKVAPAEETGKIKTEEKISRFNVQPAKELITNTSKTVTESVESTNLDLVVEKQDMEKLEKEEENGEVKVEKRGRFAIKSDQSLDTPTDPPVAEADLNTNNTEEKTSLPESEAKKESSDEKPAEVPKEEVEAKKEEVVVETQEKKEVVEEKKEVVEDDKDDDITQSEEEEPKQAVD